MQNPLDSGRSHSMVILRCPVKAIAGRRWLIRAANWLVILVIAAMPAKLVGANNPVLWQNGQWIDLLPPPGWRDFSPGAINDLGVIAGQAVNPSGTKVAVIWQNGVMTTLGSVSGNAEISARDINNSGQVAGTILENFGGSLLRTAVLWSNGTQQILTSGDATANAISGDGTVVGQAFSRGAYWLNGALGLIQGTSQIYKLNQRGQMLVWSTSTIPNGYVLIDGGAWIPLPAGVSAHDMNDSGQVVGSYRFNAHSRAFIWDRINGMRDSGLPAWTTWPTGSIISAKSSDGSKPTECGTHFSGKTIPSPIWAHSAALPGTPATSMTKAR
jgi:hypothetical protein